MDSMGTGSQAVSTSSLPRADETPSIQAQLDHDSIASESNTGADFFTRSSDSGGATSRDEPSIQDRAEPTETAAPLIPKARTPAPAAPAAPAAPSAAAPVEQTPPPPLSTPPPPQPPASYKETWREAANRNLFKILSKSRKARTTGSMTSSTSSMPVSHDRASLSSDEVFFCFFWYHGFPLCPQPPTQT